MLIRSIDVVVLLLSRSLSRRYNDPTSQVRREALALVLIGIKLGFYYEDGYSSRVAKLGRYINARLVDIQRRLSLTLAAKDISSILYTSRIYMLISATFRSRRKCVSRYNRRYLSVYNSRSASRSLIQIVKLYIDCLYRYSTVQYFSTAASCRFIGFQIRLSRNFEKKLKVQQSLLYLFSNAFQRS